VKKIARELKLLVFFMFASVVCLLLEPEPYLKV
jgi:hypothetical protein